MQFLKLSQDTTLKDLSNRVGRRNVEQILTLNDMKRCHNIGKAFKSKCDSIASDKSIVVDHNMKLKILNTFVSDSDTFEMASLLDNNGWRVLSKLDTFPNYLRIPESNELPDAEDIIGNGLHVSDLVYRGVKKDLLTPPNIIDPSRFNDQPSARKGYKLDDLVYNQTTDNSKIYSLAYQDFHIPWGEVSIYSSLADASLDIPVYPEEVQDGRSANYGTMPDILYQYEPWQVYQSSGPRNNQYEFHMHRDMWTGDHRDGKANELIRFCQANCYPKYNGSAVNTSTVTLYVGGNPLISGVLTSAEVKWSGPIGLDNWYLEFTLTLSITEVSNQPLNYDTVKQLNLIQ